MGKLKSDVNFLPRNNKRRIGNDKKQEIKPKRKKRKKDLEKLHRNAIEASKTSFTRVYRNGAKGKEIRKGNLPANKFYKARLQGEVAKLLDRDTPKKSINLFEQSPKIVYLDLLENKETKVDAEDSASSDGDLLCPVKKTKKPLTTSRKFPWSAMFRYEEFCAIICSENFDDRSVILSQLPDPLQNVRESLKRIHTNAIRQHFSRPDMDINDYIVDLKNHSSSKILANETNRIHVLNIPTVSSLTDHSSNTTLTADIVEDSHSEISPKNTNEVETKSQSNNILFSLPMELPKNMKNKNIDTAKNFHLPYELFSQPCSTSTIVDNESIMEKYYGRYAKCHIDNVKCNARLKKHDKHIPKNCTKYIANVEEKKALSDTEMRKRFTFINDSSKRNIQRNHVQTQKYVEDLVNDYKSRRTIQDTTDINDGGSCTKLKERAIAWKATKNLKHVPGILRSSACNFTGLSDLTFTFEQKYNNANLKRTPKKHLDLNLNICPSGSLNETIINFQRVKTNKCPEHQHRTMKEKPSTSTHRTVNMNKHIEANVGDKNNKIDIAEESSRYTQFRPQKSVTFTKGILRNADTSTTQLHYDQTNDTTKPVNVNKSATSINPINCQILEGSQHVLLNPEQVHQPNLKFIQPTQYIECSQNSHDTKESIPVYFQIINEPMKVRAEQNVTNQLLINKPVTTFATCEKTLPNQSMIQQPVVPVASQNVQFMLRENDPCLYAFSELQNLQLLKLNDSKNIYVSTLNSAHEQKRANECAILHNVNQPTKYLAFEKDLSTQRIPIYFHNNSDKTVTQQYLPCKVVTAMEKQNNDKVFIHEPSSQVILVQGNNLQHGDGQFIDRNYKHFI